MNSPSAGPDFLLPPGLYAYSDLEVLATHPEVAPETAREFYTVLIVRNTVLFGRIALLHEDIGNYQAWGTYVEAYADRLQIRPDLSYVREVYFKHLASFYLHGAAAADTEAATKLHELLTSDAEGRRLEGVIDLCIQEDLPPDGWITAHATTADTRARSWQYYASHKLFTGLGDPTRTEGIWGPGMAAAAEEFIRGDVSAGQGIIFAQSLIKLAPKELKYRILSRTAEIASELSAEPARFGRHEIHLIRLVQQINLQTDVSLSTKQYISEQVRRAIEWSSEVTENERTRFEISCAIAADTMSITEVINRVDQVTGQQENLYQRARERNSLLGFVARTYSEQGQLDNAASIVSAISGVHNWNYSLLEFAYAGGDVVAVQTADQMRAIMGQDDLWAARKIRGDAVAALVAEDSQAVGELIFDMLDQAATGSADSHLADFATNIISRLAKQDSDAFYRLGSKLLTRLQNKSGGHQETLLYLLAEHSVPGSAEAYWKYVNQTPTPHPAMYFARYARAALATARPQL